MPETNLIKTHDHFESVVEHYSTFLRLMTGPQSPIKKGHQVDFVESVMLRLTAHWEKFSGEVLARNLYHNRGQLTGFQKVPISKRSTIKFYRIHVAGARCINSREPLKLIRFAKRHLSRDLNPFLKIQRIHESRITEVYGIRHYLAHYGANERKYLTNKFGPKGSQPGLLLLKEDGRLLWDYLAAFEGASRDMRGDAGGKSGGSEVTSLEIIRIDLV